MRTVLFDILNNTSNLLEARKKVNVQSYSELEDIMLDTINYLHNCRIGLIRVMVDNEWQFMDLYDVNCQFSSEGL